MQKIFLTVVLSLLFFTQNIHAQNMSDNFKKEWEQVDSLYMRGLPKSAIEMAQKIQTVAEQKKDSPNMIKAQLFLLAANDGHEEGAEVSNITLAESYIAKASGIEKALWQSITAEMYWNYYQNNRWQILRRTTLEVNTSTDIATWDARSFYHKVAGLYQASIEQKQLLRNTAVDKYAPLIIKGVNTQLLRPTIYDLLVFRAIHYFSNDEKELINAADKFEIGAQPWFDAADKFSEVKVKVNHTDALHFLALKLYQEVIAFHLHDAEPSALIDADLHRLKFVHTYSISSTKDSLYLAALQQIAQKYPTNTAIAQVKFLMLQQAYSISDVAVYGSKSGETPQGKSARNLPEILKSLYAITTEFKGSEGAINAANLINEIEQKSIALQTEDVNIPNEAIRALVTYKNTPTVYFRLYKAEEGDMRNRYTESDEYIAKLGKRTVLKKWTQSLPATEDLESHSAEVKIDALNTGNYIIVASSADDLNVKESVVTSLSFTVSNISLVKNSNQKRAYVLHRKTGQPIANAAVTFWTEKYNSKTYNYDKIFHSTVKTTADGSFTLVESENYNNRIGSVTIKSGDDELMLDGGYNVFKGRPNKNEHTYTTFLFTDRSLYRPGQTVYFKGIMLKSTNNNKTNEVVSNFKAKVTFKDANYQEVNAVELTTNAFGSFTGTFVAPENGLTGSMHIATNFGSVYFNVEEYKRPKFQVAFDTLKSNYALNEAVVVKGNAKAYAGNNIDGATVKYRVVRKVYFPYYWRCFYWGYTPNNQEVEIANGTTTTDADGLFTVPFTALPDRSINPETLPTFTYHIYADVTDINGETRSGNTRLNCGYTSLQLAATATDKKGNLGAKMLHVKTQNLNGVFTPADVGVAIYKLKYPGFFRKRLWQKPDQFVFDEQAFHNYFPADEYKDESNYMSWEKGAVLWQNSIMTTADGAINVPDKTWQQNGWYVIELRAKDAQGNEIIEKQYAHVWNVESNQKIEQPLLVKTDADSYEPGSKAKIWLATAIDNPHFLHTSDKALSSSKPFVVSISEDDRGGLVYSWLYVYQSRVYATSTMLNVPWSNKDLQIEWATHRDKLQPGEQETWTMTIKGNKKEQVAAELLAGMYDASLDAFKSHHWQWQKLFPTKYAHNTWEHYAGFGLQSSILLNTPNTPYFQYNKQYDLLYVSNQNVLLMYEKEDSRESRNPRHLNAPAPMVKSSYVGSVDRNDEDGIAAEMSPVGESIKDEIENSKNENTTTDIAIRTNLNETAFYLPQLHTDADGNVQLKFTMPEALTEWRMMAFAHTKDWKTSYLEGRVKTQKDLMVVPNVPRFFRQNDDMVVSAKISNLSDSVLSGIATLEILDAATLQPVLLPFGIRNNAQSMAVKAGQSTTAQWQIHVPESFYNPVVVRVIAKAGNFSDGEDQTIPVVSNRMLVTETMPLPLSGNEEKEFSLEKLLNNQSNTLAHRSLTIEYTSNPAWYAVQALPYLMEYPYECAEQTFNRYYANALAGFIVQQSPKVAQIFEQWQSKDTAALLSNLQKNQELKSALLEETPWVLEAQNEQQQKQQIAQLFKAHKLSKELKSNLDKLEKMMLPEGAFPWFKGMHANRYITQYIVTGIARLQHLGAAKSEALAIANKAIPYLDRQLADDYNYLLKHKADLKIQQISNTQVQYLYMRSFFKNSMSATVQKAFNFYLAQAAKYWPQFNPYMKGQIALALNRYEQTNTAKSILQSLSETAVTHPEMGMYWKSMSGGYWWYEAPIEAQALLIEAYTEISNDTKAANEMKTWLLKQKQTQNWKTTKATADACYALLLQGSNWLSAQPNVHISLGSKNININKDNSEAGTGYYKEVIPGADVRSDMGSVKIKVRDKDMGANNKMPSWGAVHWQYFEEMDKVTGAASPLKVTKQLFIERNTPNGPVLSEIKDGSKLQVGDKVKVRVVLQSDRDMEYVHLKDMRAACLEPVNVLSGYKYQNGLGYYESTKDLATHFFFDYVRKGTYVFEYAVFVNAKGTFSNGISTAQCMYAPEFSSHTGGQRIVVE